MKGYNEKELRALLKDKEKQLKELTQQTDDVLETLNMLKHPSSPMASIPNETIKNLEETLDIYEKKRERLTLVINCVKDNLRKMHNAKIEYEKIYKSNFKDSMFYLKQFKI